MAVTPSDKKDHLLKRALKEISNKVIKDQNLLEIYLSLFGNH